MKLSTCYILVLSAKGDVDREMLADAVVVLLSSITTCGLFAGAATVCFRPSAERTPEGAFFLLPSAVNSVKK